MKKEDLKTGMRITLRNGHSAVVMLNTKNGDIFSSVENGERETWGDLRFYDNNMKSEFGRHADIVMVEDFTTNSGVFSSYYIIWEREVEEMTLEQVCKELGREIKIVK